MPAELFPHGNEVPALLSFGPPALPPPCSILLAGFFDTSLWYSMIRNRKAQGQRCTASAKEADVMKGYNVESGYMGLVEGRYMLFASEAEYMEFLKEDI